MILLCTHVYNLLILFLKYIIFYLKKKPCLTFVKNNKSDCFKWNFILYQIYHAITCNENKKLYFNVVTEGNNRTLMVEAGGVKATVIQEDIAATNGVIHIIDRVLGVPYTTILERLRTDPVLK